MCDSNFLYLDLSFEGFVENKTVSLLFEIYSGSDELVVSKFDKSTKRAVYSLEPDLNLPARKAFGTI